MAEMKDSGIHAIGRIPKEWNVVRTKYLSNISIGLVTTMTENYVEKEEGVPLIRNGNIRCNKIDVNGMVFLDKRFAEKNKHRQLHTGQIATVHTGDVGTSIVIPEEYDGGLGFATIQSTPYKGVSSEFLCWFYNSAAFKNQCIECSTGDGRQNLNLYDFVDLFVAIPKYDLQSKIASFLDKKCAEIDSLHTDIEKQIETLEEYKKSIITEAVTKGLDPYVEMKDSGIEWIGMIPKNWNVTRIGYESWIRARLGWKGLKAEEYVLEGHPFLSAFNIIQNKISWDELNYITNERYNESPEIMLKVGDIVLVKDGAGIGKCAKIDCLPYETATTNGSLAVISSTVEKLDYNYLYFYLQSAMFQNYILRIMNGMGVPHLSQEELRKIKIPFPPINEQIEIAKYLEKKRNDIDMAILEKIQQLETLEQYKKSVIYEYVTGKKEVQ